MSDTNDRTKKLEDARMLAKITTAWKEAEEALAAMDMKLKDANTQTDYWVSAYTRQAEHIANLNLRIKELESPLAELARQGLDEK
jgi:ABC-type Fe3+-hydroxamate transport system substrate-binding protein